LEIQYIKIQFDNYSTLVQLLSLAKDISIGNPDSLTSVAPSSKKPTHNHHKIKHDFALAPEKIYPLNNKFKAIDGVKNLHSKLTLKMLWEIFILT